MHKHSDPRRLAGIAVTAASTLWMATGESIAAQPFAPDLRVAVFAEHFVLAGRVIDDLDVLEREVAALRPQAISFEACGAGTARSQRGAAHRFRDVPIELRVLEPDAPACQAWTGPRTVQASHRRGPRPFGIDDAIVDRWWHDQMP